MGRTVYCVENCLQDADFVIFFMCFVYLHYSWKVCIYKATFLTGSRHFWKTTVATGPRFQGLPNIAASPEQEINAFFLIPWDYLKK